jgi:hypothetical protein
MFHIKRKVQVGIVHRKSQSRFQLERRDGTIDTHNPGYLVDHNVYYGTDDDSDDGEDDKWTTLDPSKLQIKIGDFGTGKIAVTFS